MSTASTTPTVSQITAHRPGLRSLLTMVGVEVKMVARDTAGLLLPVAMPVLIMVMSAGNASDEVVTNDRTVLDIFVMPIVLAMVLCMIGVINMPSFLTTYRKTGVLRRLGVTPASPFMVLVAQVITSILQSIVGIGLALAVAVLGYGLNAPIHLGTALGVTVLTALAMYSLGMIVAAVAPTPNAAIALGLIAFMALGASGGMFGGAGNLPEPVAEIGAYLPYGASVEALGAAWAGESVAAAPVLSLVGAIIVGIVVSVAFFRWE